MKILIQNKKAYHDFTIIKDYEAGVVLKGSEIKSLRAGRGNLKDSFVRIIKGELFFTRRAHQLSRHDKRAF